MQLNRNTTTTTDRPIKVLQFGEGNFLRAFIDWVIHRLNQEGDFHGNVAVVQPLAEGMVPLLEQQQGLYHLVLQGIQNGSLVRNFELIDCLSRFNNPYQYFSGYLELGLEEELRFVFSNTTEAGITFVDTDRFEDDAQVSFPAKLCRLLYHRYQYYNGDLDKGLFIIPCELINHNGDQLKKCIKNYIALWELEADFENWIDKANTFCNTLVDRIVPGFPKSTISEIQEEIGYEDQLVVEGEVFHLWVIEGGDKVKAHFPTEKLGLNVIFTDNQQPFRQRKVHILNGAHTAMVPLGLLAGLETVKETVEHEVFSLFLDQMVSKEINPTLDLSENELIEFGAAVFERFKNPYIKHYLSSIALNALSKYETRILPCVKTFYEQKRCLPAKLVVPLSAYILMYAQAHPAVNDDEGKVKQLQSLWQQDNLTVAVNEILTNPNVFTAHSMEIPNLADLVVAQIQDLQEKGVINMLKEMVQIDPISVSSVK
ncbi:tagaturonate reductase [Persicobacter diffluens]|uniref:Altronate oxidoreductase n=1 Tax=Persicobacter diffluens TaxID=981 RepID=A0AAN4W3I7_9BACT|nr:altronate oxidoreductase [Persicobacter diffluens]